MKKDVKIAVPMVLYGNESWKLLELKKTGEKNIGGMQVSQVFHLNAIFHDG
jgi:hypothetical protein